MSVYLNDLPLPEAVARLDAALAATGLGGLLAEESIPLDENALGRVLAAPLFARQSAPHYHAAAMDGFALRARATANATPTRPLTLAVPDAAVYVDTGDPLPGWADAVVPIEEVEPLSTDGALSGALRAPASIRLRAALPPWRHVRPLGEDMVAGELVLPSGHTLRPADLGALAGSGFHEIPVARRPRVAVLPTGSELRPIGQPVGPGEIIEYNSVVMAAQIRELGGSATRFPVTPDDPAQIRTRVLAAAADHDLVLLNAGSSAGSADFTAAVVAELGELLVHGIAVRPGHPVVIGMIAATQLAGNRPVPIIGVPGYPVSAALTVDILVAPLLRRWLGRPAAAPETVTAALTRKLVSPAGDDDYVRVAVARVGQRTLAAPLTRGAGVISSLVRADGLVVVPRGGQGHQAGDEVQVRLLRPAATLEQTILASGSHDMTLDLLAQFLAGRGRRLASANVGSVGGLIALHRGEAHLAGSHLLDPESGVYNLAYLDRYLPGLDVTVIGLVGREQGLIVAAGNPRGIRNLHDLARPDVRYANRQRGAGTRVLLDYHLDQNQIPAAAINGYDSEQITHLAVAAAVAGRRADCGLGIPAAAAALQLDFIPLFEEEYDLVIPADHAASDLLRPLLELLHENGLRKAIEALPGYDTSRLGRQVWPQPTSR